MSWDVTIDFLCSILLTVLLAVVLLNVCILLVVYTCVVITLLLFFVEWRDTITLGLF